MYRIVVYKLNKTSKEETTIKSTAKKNPEQDLIIQI